MASIGSGGVRDRRTTSSDCNGISLGDEDEFEDAVEIQRPAEQMDLHTALTETQVAVNLFLNNHFTLAKEKMEPWADRSMYHALGYGTILYIQAMMTFDASDIEAAMRQTRVASAVCNLYRKPQSRLTQVTKLVRLGSSTKYTDEEMHAELCYAESLLERALLMFVKDENLVSFLKGALKIRSCFNSYKECQRILLESSAWLGEEKLRPHFESGVKMGLGAFNLLISVLPSRVLKLLEFMGFGGDRDFGLTQLRAASVEPALRQPLCALLLLGYETVVTYVLGIGDADIPMCDQIIAPLLQLYPKGALVLYFAGRLEEIKGNIDSAIHYFNESVNAQSEWRQFHHLCYWELMFCHAFKRDWATAAKYAHKLYLENKWSPATYAYMNGVFLYTLRPWNLTWDERATMKKMFEQVPILKQRIAGKSIPVEKYCVTKSEKYFKEGESLLLPNYEILHMWNGFAILGKNESLLKPILAEIEETLQKNEKLDTWDEDSHSLCLFLKAMCLKNLQSPFQAEQCLKHIISNEKLLVGSYLVPNAYLETALLHLEENRLSEAEKCLNRAKEFKGYLFESRVHFKIHAATARIQGLARA